MTVTIIRGAEVNRPEPDAIKSSVLDHATVIDKTDFGLRNNAGLWPSYNCLDLLVPTPICPDPDDDVEPKEFTVAGWVPAFEFAVHGGVQCGAVGLDAADQKREVARVFERSEGKGIERALLANRFVASTAGAPVEWDAPVDLGSTEIKAALALLEGYAAAVYAGVPTIHMSRAAASVLGDRIVWEGDKAYTRLGSKVAMGGGYDDPDTPFDGTFTMYATGEVYVERSEEVMIQSYVLPGDGSGAQGLTDNTVIALAERMFRVGVDCFVAKVTGSISTGGGGMGTGVQNVVDNGDGTFSLLLTDGTTTDPVALIPGPQGPEGPQGPAGADGAPGADGADGADGAPGVVQTIVAGTGVTVDDTDPANPIVGVE